MLLPNEENTDVHRREEGVNDDGVERTGDNTSNFFSLKGDSFSPFISLINDNGQYSRQLRFFLLVFGLEALRQTLRVKPQKAGTPFQAPAMQLENWLKPRIGDEVRQKMNSITSFFQPIYPT